MVPFDNYRGSPEITPNTPNENKGVMKSLSYIADDVASDSLKPADKRDRFRIFLDLGKDTRAFLNKSAEIEAKPFDHFAANISAGFGVPREKILADAALKQAFLELKDYELNNQKRNKEKKKYLGVSNRVDLFVAGYVGEQKEEVGEFRNGYMRVEKERKYLKKLALLEDDPKATPEQKQLVRNCWEKKQQLNEKYEKNEITKEQYLVENEKLNEDTAKQSGDKDLMKEYDDYKANSVEPFEAKVAIVPLVPSDKLVEDKTQVQEALASVDSDNFQLNIHDDGSASVVVGPEKFPMEVRVYKNDQTNDFVYYISDKYAANGSLRVESNLSEALDGRYLDSYISDKLGIVSDDNDSPNKIPDEMMNKFALKLLGNGKSRDYKIEGENREVLNAMIKVLELPSEKYPNYYKKIEALNVFFEKEDNIAGLRRRLLAGEKMSLDDL